MEIHEALEDIAIAFRQLEFAVKLLSFIELGKIDPKDFDTDHITLLEGGSFRLPPGHFSNTDSLIRAASVSVLLAFSVSALVLDKGFEGCWHREQSGSQRQCGKAPNIDLHGALRSGTRYRRSSLEGPWRICPNDNR